MLEKFNSPENKFITDQEVIEALRTKGNEDTETRALLLKWTEQNETEANNINTSKANIECIIKQALLYKEAGYVAEALESLENAQLAAFNEKETELYQQIIAIIDSID
ncbi:MAG: hypothetical protein Q8Q95_03075 [bacterium]|nr:hypothetical protein [bacterium]